MDQIKYKEVIAEAKKTYEHEVFYIVNKNGKILRLRASFDEDKLFIRSAKIVNVEKAHEIKDIVISDKSFERAPSNES